jgi:hypothetical protein
VSATGKSGFYNASAATSLLTGQLVESLNTTASGSADGTSLAAAEALVGGTNPASTAYQAEAFEDGAPTATTTSAVLADNSNIKTAFGASPVFFATGELGGRYSTSGTGSETTTSTLDESIDLTQLATRGDLIVGLYSGDAVGTGVTGVTFTLYADGVQEIDQSYSGASAAASMATFFDDHAFNFGSLASSPLNADTLSLSATLTVTTDAASSGFYGDVIIGDPPAPAAAPSAATSSKAGAATASASKFVADMAGFAAAPSAAGDIVAHEQRFTPSPLVAPRFAIA